jgi:hypothetical protein
MIPGTWRHAQPIIFELARSIEERDRRTDGPTQHAAILINVLQCAGAPHWLVAPLTSIQ